MVRPQVFLGIHVCSLAKQIQRSFDKSLHCHEVLMWMQIPKVLSARHAFVDLVHCYRNVRETQWIPNKQKARRL